VILAGGFVFAEITSGESSASSVTERKACPLPFKKAAFGACTTD